MEMTYNGMRLTYHCGVEREYRFCQIQENIGFGQIIKEQFVRGCFTCLTDTGIIFVISADRTKIITLYVATVANLYCIFASDRRIPTWLVKKVNRNQSLYIRHGKTIWE